MRAWIVAAVDSVVRYQGGCGKSDTHAILPRLCFRRFRVLLVLKARQFEYRMGTETPPQASQTHRIHTETTHSTIVVTVPWTTHQGFDGSLDPRSHKPCIVTKKRVFRFVERGAIPVGGPGPSLSIGHDVADQNDTSQFRRRQVRGLLEQKDVLGPGGGVEQENSGAKGARIACGGVCCCWSNYVTVQRGFIVVVVDQGRGLYSLR
mmetsp:Transcript_2757/g.6170  ORF Transcript_2757/g.6170 Transcript_2757/m.6170 type:complete len:206 (-) Transcript_2757:393-1010(-)